MSNGDGNGKAWWATLPALLGALAALITAGVGVAAFVAKDDGGGDPPPTPVGVTQTTGSDTPTKEEWAREATDVCARFRDEVTSVQAANPNANFDPAQAVALIEQSVAAASRAGDDLDDIPAPPEWENDIGELIAVIDQQVLGYRNALGALRAGDQATAQQSLAEAESLTPREESLWRRLDVRGCAG